MRHSSLAVILIGLVRLESLRRSDGGLEKSGNSHGGKHFYRAVAENYQNLWTDFEYEIELETMEE